MIQRNKIFILTVLLLGLFNPAMNADLKKVAQAGYQFLKIDADARAAAMGGANLLAGTGASSMFYNPAGMTELSGNVDLFGTQTYWIADISYFTFGVTKDLGKVGVIGFSMQTADYGKIIGTRVDDSPENTAGFIETGNVQVGASAMGISFARRLTDRFAVGVQVKYVSQNLGETLMPDGMKSNKTNGLAYDFGTLYYPGVKSFRFGMGIRNFAKDFKYEDDSFSLPLTFTIGAALDATDFYGGIGENHDLLIEVDASHPRDYTERIHLGWEYGYRKMLYLRSGYKSNHDTEGLSLGFGLRIPLAAFQAKLDYSYTNAGDFSPVSRFSVGFFF